MGDDCYTGNWKDWIEKYSECKFISVVSDHWIEPDHHIEKLLNFLLAPRIKVLISVLNGDKNTFKWNGGAKRRGKSTFFIPFPICFRSKSPMLICRLCEFTTWWHIAKRFCRHMFLVTLFKSSKRDKLQIFFVDMIHRQIILGKWSSQIHFQDARVW